MLKSEIVRGVAACVAVFGVFALTACDSETSTASSDVSRLGSPVKVSASSGLYSDEFAGTVNVDSGPVCAAAKGARVVVFHVRASAVVDDYQAPPNGEHNPARPGDCSRLCGAPGCASWGCLS